jgi:hypothetical protein
MTKLQNKTRLEVLKVRIGINTQMISDEVWKRTDAPHMHDYYIDKLNTAKTEYLDILREVLVPNKTYIMDMGNTIIPYDEDTNIVTFLRNNMVYGEYKTEHDDFFYDAEKPFVIHRYSDYGGETMEDNRAEIIECLYVSQWTFLVDDEGNTIINGRPEFDYYDGDVINVKITKNIFDTDLITNISLASL